MVDSSLVARPTRRKYGNGSLSFASSSFREPSRRVMRACGQLAQPYPVRVGRFNEVGASLARALGWNRERGGT
jgi:hypothetical protein